MSTNEQTAGKAERPQPLRITIGLLVVIVGTVLIVYPSLGRDEIDGLDSAHHVMSGIFFADALRDLPVTNAYEYTLDYYSQYPALGFTFWPPFFHFVEGVVFSLVGIEPIAPRITMLCFALVLAVLLYLTGLSRVGAGYAAIAALLVLSTPVITDLARTVMLEVPALAMGFVVLFVYERASLRGRWSGWLEPLLVALLAAAAMYTKQTVAFMLAAIAVHLVLENNHLLKRVSTWAAAVLFLVLMAPLVVFTLQFGRVNLEQSFGSIEELGGAYETHSSADADSLEAWTYYARVILDQNHLLICVLALTGGLLVLSRSQLRKPVSLWMLYLASFYTMFSLFENKRGRFAAFAVPAVVLLAVGSWYVLTRKRRRLRLAIAVVLWGVILWQMVGAYRDEPRPGFGGTLELMEELVARRPDTNIAYFGDYRQIFVPALREVDDDRKLYFLQGDDIVEAAGGLTAAASRYRVGWLLVEHGARLDAELRGSDAASPFRHYRDMSFGPPDRRLGLSIYQHVGDLAQQMDRVPLRSEVQGINER